MTKEQDADLYYLAIQKSGLSIYSDIAINTKLWMPIEVLKTLLNCSLIGVNLRGLPLRTRSKKVKELVCKALGFQAPNSFKKTQPRFPAQDLDTYVQKSNNLQIWNEEITPSRRYAIIRVSEDGIVVKVKIVTGSALESLDKTGTLTQKYQARLILGNYSRELITEKDTGRLVDHLSDNADMKGHKPTNYPVHGALFPIAILFDKLVPLIGLRIIDPGKDQERNRGAELQRLVCQALGYDAYLDNGRFPDILNQLLEVKLQTSLTVDLGLVTPDSLNCLDIPNLSNHPFRHCDVRYALFYGSTDGLEITLTHLFLTTGRSFFSRFPQFHGKVLNRKLQIPLPRNFFD